MIIRALWVDGYADRWSECGSLVGCGFELECLCCSRSLSKADLGEPCVIEMRRVCGQCGDRLVVFEKDHVAFLWILWIFRCDPCWFREVSELDADRHIGAFGNFHVICEFDPVAFFGFELRTEFGVESI